MTTAASHHSLLPIVQPSGTSGTAPLCDRSGSALGGCGSSAGPQDLPPDVWEKIGKHPCYSEEAHHYYARMHVAVAPACNIQCNYCNRKFDCSNESRPGVVSERLTPEQAAKKVLAVASEIPQLTVLGIAGPGDPLANPDKTFRTFELVKAQAPDIKLCLSTNGLMLPEFVDRIAALGVDHVTVTINTVDPAIGARIYPWVYFRGTKFTGEEASRLLIQRQLLGLEMLRERGILAKVNSVMIPGINDQHLVEVNREVKKRGAFLHNIMPLISAPEHGTVFGLTGQRGPTAQELKTLQDSCQDGMKMMRHCRQCRADAVGMLGEDRSAEFTAEKVMSIEVNYDVKARKAYQDAVEEQRRAVAAERDAELAALAACKSEISILVAVASKGKGRINEHFGHAREFQVWEVNTAGAKFVGHRRVDQYCQGGFGEEDSLDNVVRAIRDCAAVLVARIGACPRKGLSGAGIEASDEFGLEPIEPSLLRYYASYCQRIEAGEIKPQPRGDAAIRQGALTA
jgi:nitrogen fixation protein NifB